MLFSQMRSFVSISLGSDSLNILYGNIKAHNSVSISQSHSLSFIMHKTKDGVGFTCGNQSCTGSC